MLPPRLSPSRRSDDLVRLTSEQLDVLVVGGGIVGAGVALDAVTRGLSVGLVEAQDWGSGTSSRSSKLIHGGLRYLEMMDFGLVHQALKERALLLQRLAPHLVQQLPILYPLRRPVFERLYVGAGIALYDLLGRSTGTTRGLPLHRHLSRRHALSAAPGLRGSSLVGAIEYYDAQVDDARYVLEVVRTAVGYGAAAVSRMAAVGFLRDGQRVIGVQVRDAESGERHDIRASVTVLATGAWTEETEALAGRERATLVRPSKGVHLVVAKEAIESSVALILRTEKSVLFVLPWGRHWLIGTTDTDWPHDKARPVATGPDVDYLLSEVNTVLAKPLSRADVQAVFAGLRPLVAGIGVVRGPGETGGPPLGGRHDEPETTKVSREHAVSRPAPGLVVVSGGKYTTYRVMAVDAVDAAVASALESEDRAGGADRRAAGRRFRSAPPSLTDEVPLLGAEGFRVTWTQRARLAKAHGLPEGAIERLLHRYGGLVEEVLALSDGDPTLSGRLTDEEEYLRAEVVYAVSHEGARHLDDILLRRLRLGIEAADEAARIAPEVGRLVAPLLGWDDAGQAAEVEEYRRQAALEQQAASTNSDDEAARLVAETPTLLPVP